MKTRNVTISNADIYTVVPLLNSLVGKDLPILGAYKLAKLVGALQDEFDLLEKHRVQLVEKFAERDDKGNLIYQPQKNPDDPNKQVRIADSEGFAKELQELMEQNHEIEIVELAVAELGGETTISVRDIYPIARLGLLAD